MMHPRLLFLTVCLLAQPALVAAQAQPAEPPTETLPASEPAPVTALPQAVPPATREGRSSIEVAYFGQNFIRPGVQVGYSYRALQSPGRLHALVVGADAGAYFWLRHDFGVFVLPRVGWRGRHRAGLQGEANFHLGYLQSVLASPAYQVDAGQVVEASRAGVSNLLLGVTAGVGWFIPRAGVTPFARAGVVWHTPVFDQVMLRFVLNLGVEVRL